MHRFEVGRNLSTETLFEYLLLTEHRIPNALLKEDFCLVQFSQEVRAMKIIFPNLHTLYNVRDRNSERERNKQTDRDKQIERQTQVDRPTGGQTD